MENSRDPRGLSNRQKQGKTRIESEETILLDTQEWFIVIPHTHRSAIYWSQNAAWDTSVKNNDRCFNAYNNKGNLYIIRNKYSTKAYQFHIESKAFYDDQNVRIDPLRFFTEYKPTFNAIFIHLESFDRQKEFMDSLV
jgi:hypothetical protein